MVKRVDKVVYYATYLVLTGEFKEVVRKHGGVLLLGIGTEVEGVLMEGVSVSTLADLDEFIEVGKAAEKILGRPGPRCHQRR